MLSFRLKQAKIAILSFLFSALLLPSCSFSKNSSSQKEESSTANTSSYVDQGSIEIVRRKNALIQDYEYCFTNGGFSRFDVVKKNENGEVNSIPSFACKWSVEDEEYMSVDSVGSVTPKKNGTSKLFAKFGDYSAEKEIKIATIAKTFQMKEVGRDYRKGNRYSFPLLIEPSTASLFFSFSSDKVIELTDRSNEFFVKSEGSVNVHVEAYTEYTGAKTAFDFTIETISPSSPTFEVNGQTCTSYEATFAKNKYQSIPYDELGIKAYSSQRIDITDKIRIDSGSIDFGQEGDYSLVLAVTDETKNLTSYFSLFVNIIPYETKKVKNPGDGIIESNFQYELVKEPGSFAIHDILFSIDVALNPKYDDSTAEITFHINFTLRYWGNSNRSPLEVSQIAKKSFTIGGEKTIHFDYAYHSNSFLDPNTFVLGSCFTSANGYFYTYTSY